MKGDESAFPQANINRVPVEGYHYTFKEGFLFSGGLTKRELLAGMALQGWIINMGFRRSESGYSDVSAAIEAAKLSRETADALLRELAGEGEGK